MMNYASVSYDRAMTTMPLRGIQEKPKPTNHSHEITTGPSWAKPLSDMYAIATLARVPKRRDCRTRGFCNLWTHRVRGGKT